MPKRSGTILAAILLAFISLFASQPSTAYTQDLYTSYLPLIRQGIAQESGSLADGWYLLVDDGHIQFRDVERLYHPFQKYAYNPIMRADRTWEGHIIQLFGTVMPGFRMWYSSFNPDQNLAQVLYATSIDGVNWIKPNLSGGTNALFNGQNANLASVLFTPDDFFKPFKLMVFQNDAFYGYYSQDGLLTTSYAENPLYNNGSDVAQFYWDAHTGRYRGTAKQVVSVFGIDRRVIKLIDSDDFVHWQEQPDLFQPDVIDELLYPDFDTNFYGMPVFPSGNQYLGLLWIMKARDPARQHGPVNIQLASSHDGTVWLREESNRPPILDVGPVGAWDSGQVYTSVSPLHVGDELWLYYSGCNKEHGALIQNTVCSIGLAKAPYNRLASLTGSGLIRTETLTAYEGTLRLNYDGSRGSVLVELQQDGAPIPGYEAANCLPLTTDSLDQVVSWNGQSELPGEPFQIQFTLVDSAVYAFKIGSE